MNRNTCTNALRKVAAAAATAAVSAAAVAATSAAAQEVNVYSGRQEVLIRPQLEAFTAATGIEVNLIAGSSNELIERIRTEGANSPADVLLTVDVGRLTLAKNLGLLQSVDSETLRASIRRSTAMPRAPGTDSACGAASSTMRPAGSIRPSSPRTNSSPTPCGKAASAFARPPTSTTSRCSLR